MTGAKTHEQNQRIINRQENTANGPADFPLEADLKASDALKDARQAARS